MAGGSCGQRHSGIDRLTCLRSRAAHATGAARWQRLAPQLVNSAAHLEQHWFQLVRDAEAVMVSATSGCPLWPTGTSTTTMMRWKETNSFGDGSGATALVRSRERRAPTGNVSWVDGVLGCGFSSARSVFIEGAFQPCVRLVLDSRAFRYFRYARRSWVRRPQIQPLLPMTGYSAAEGCRRFSRPPTRLVVRRTTHSSLQVMR